MPVGAAIVGAGRQMFRDFSCRVRAPLVATFGSQNQTDDVVAKSTRIITEALVGKKGWILLSRAPLSYFIMRPLCLKVFVGAGSHEGG
jgi:hypothetical protein